MQESLRQNVIKITFLNIFTWQWITVVSGKLSVKLIDIGWIYVNMIYCWWFLTLDFFLKIKFKELWISVLYWAAFPIHSTVLFEI